MNTSIKIGQNKNGQENGYYNKALKAFLTLNYSRSFFAPGSRQHSAVELARLLIQQFGSLNAVFDASYNELAQFNGIGATKYSQLLAVKSLDGVISTIILVRLS